MAFIDTDKWREILFTVSQHKLRTALTAFGVFWGIFMLTILLGAGNALENGAVRGFPVVQNAIWIWPGGVTQIPYKGMPLGRWVNFLPEDVTAIRKSAKTVGFLAGQNEVGTYGGSQPYVVHGNSNGAFSVQGAHAGMAGINSVKVAEGRFINRIDNDEKRKVAVIGMRVKEVLFAPDENPLGQHITVQGINFQVVGVFKALFSGNSVQDEEKIYIPNETLRYAFNQAGSISTLVVLPKPGIHASVAEEEVKQLLAERHRVSPDDRGVFGSYNVQQRYDRVAGLFAGIKVFSWIVAVGTILAGAIGVGNIMLIVVKERTREIGLRKALGASPASIVAMIVQESVVITAVAGYAGLVAGVFLLEGAAKLLESAGDANMFINPEIDFTTALSAVVVLIISGLMASLLPAMKASAVNPIVALQDE